MELKKEKFVNFIEPQKDVPLPTYKASVFKAARRSIRKVPNLGRFNVSPKNDDDDDDHPWRNQIFDPGSEIFLQWNRAFLFSCLVTLFVDPLFFYLPTIVQAEGSTCMAIDWNLGIIVTVFRTIADVFYVMNIAFKFRTAYVSRSSRVFGKGELVIDPELIARRYLRSDFFIDFIAVLPLPQIMIWFVIPAIKTAESDYTNNALVLVVLAQYIPRLYLIFPLSSQITKAAGVVTETAWAGAAYNIVLYLLASHLTGCFQVMGSVWYLCSIERYATCWKSVCQRDSGNQTPCLSSYLVCKNLEKPVRKIWAESTRVFSKCDLNSKSDPTVFDYGMFSNALSKKVASATFFEKYLYCLWWGMQSLSSYGTNSSTTTFIGETIFAIIVSIVGLVLFAHLVGNIQTYLKSITARLEEWRLKRRDTEEWMRHRQLPENLREHVRRFIQYKWLATRAVDEEAIMRQLPADLRRDIRRHLCLDLVRRVPLFSQMDDQLLDAICERLVSSLVTQGTYIVREGDPVTEMLFVIRGRLESSTTDGGRSGFFNSIALKPGDFCGEELLAWALLPSSNSNLPSSTRTVRATEEVVEAFTLGANDLKFVANQFRRLHSKKLQHTFRLYSHHWRTWGACFIQTVWHRFKRRKMAKNLSMAESMSSFRMVHEEYPGDETARYCLVPKQAMVMKRSLAQQSVPNHKEKNGVEMAVLRKPEEPDFSTEASEEDM
ncbi:Probable cyclic nucleotide-gated ion channel 14 [Linum perenne]